MDESIPIQQNSSSSDGGVSIARASITSNGGDDRMVHFALSRLSALKIQKGDITRWFVDGTSDAIVSNYFLLTDQLLFSFVHMLYFQSYQSLSLSSVSQN
uniref:Uncharacterized protein n=1 Tax=Nelumbo nucifera TaxID=4432 RepID=A0A822Y0I0_NELNU|nr:TPA_asm: hypothetical protein HUJ06_027270 [Nelumbo nucifera]